MAIIIITGTCNFIVIYPGELVAVKILESIHEVLEEIEEEYQILRDLSDHPNMPQFFGLFLKQNPNSDAQLWITMQVGGI